MAYLLALQRLHQGGADGGLLWMKPKKIALSHFAMKRSSALTALLYPRLFAQFQTGQDFIPNNVVVLVLLIPFAVDFCSWFSAAFNSSLSESVLLVSPRDGRWLEVSSDRLSHQVINQFAGITLVFQPIWSTRKDSHIQSVFLWCEGVSNAKFSSEPELNNFIFPRQSCTSLFYFSFPFMRIERIKLFSSKLQLSACFE